MASRNGGHFIKEWRQSMHMAQKEFAAYVGLSPSNYNYLERGEIGYTQTSLETIAKALEISPAMLLSVNPLNPVPNDNEDEGTLAYEAMRMVDEMSAENQVLAVELLRAIRKLEARLEMPILKKKIEAKRKRS